MRVVFVSVRRMVVDRNRPVDPGSTQRSHRRISLLLGPFLKTLNWQGLY